jgi:hypothetical protein
VQVPTGPTSAIPLDSFERLSPSPRDNLARFVDDLVTLAGEK